MTATNRVELRMIVLGTLAVLILATGVNAGTMTFTSNRDATILQGQPSNNFGGLNFIQTGRSATAPTRSLVSFNVGALSGLYTQIDSITLRLHLSGVNDNATKTTNVYAISNANSNWVEGTSGGAPQAGAHNWNFKQYENTPTPPVNWAGSAGLSTPGASLTQSGIDYVNSLLGAQMFLNPTSIPANQQIDITFTASSAEMTSLIDNWIGVANAGLLLLDPNESTMTGQLNRMMFHSDEATTVSFRPQLIVSYTYVPAPEPSSLLLLGMGASLLGISRRLKA